MTVINKKWTESDLICNVLGERSVRDGADWLNENLPDVYKVSHGTIHNWVVGKHEPEESFVRALQLFYKVEDARYQLGAELAAMRIRKIEASIKAHWAGDSHA